MTNRGVSLVEVLIAGVIASVIAMGSLQSLKFSMQAGSVSKAILTENEFKLTVNKALTNNCYGNLKPENLTGNDKTKGIGGLKKDSTTDGLKLSNQDTEPVIKIGAFKGDIEVVKMEVKKRGSETEVTTSGGDFKRDFIAYYKKTNLGDLNTLSGLDCDTSNQEGCFKTQCQLKYTLDNPGTTETEGGCESLTCHPVVLVAGVGGRYPCPWGHLYNPDHKTTNKPKCEDRNKIIAGATGSTPNDRCNYVPEEKKLGGGDNQRQKVVDQSDPDKCICRGGYGADANIGVLNRFFLTAEGLCFGNFGHEHCMQVDTAKFKKYCSRDYQGSRECVKQTTSEGGTIYYKRVYNRETGDVVCVGSEGQKVGAMIDSSGYLEKTNWRGKFFIIPPPPSWFMPPLQ